MTKERKKRLNYRGRTGGAAFSDENGAYDNAQETVERRPQDPNFNRPRSMHRL